MQAANRLRRTSFRVAASSPITFVQSLGNSYTSSGASLTLTLTTAVSAGHSILLVARGTSGQYATATTDSKGNAYTRDASTSTANTISLFRAYITSPLTSGDVVTVTMSGSGGGGILAADYSGLLQSNPLDGTATTASATGTTSVTCPSSGGVATTQADDRLIAGLSISTASSSISIAGPFTVRATAIWATPNAAAAIADYAPGIQAGRQMTGSWTGNANSAATLIAYKGS